MKLKANMFLLAAMLLAAPLTANEPSKTEIGDGYRGITLTLDADQTVFTKAGDRIDVLITFEPLHIDEVKERATATLLQNVPVLNVTPSLSAKDKTVIYLMLNPNEAQFLALSIDGKHEIRIITRKPGDQGMQPMEMATFKKLFR